MPACEKCWADAYRNTAFGGDQVGEYYRLLEERKDNPCTPEQQRGEYVGGINEDRMKRKPADAGEE